MTKRNLASLILLILLSSISAEIFEVIESGPDEVIIKFSLPHYEINAVERNGLQWQEIECSEAVIQGKEGEPELPYFTGLLGVPHDGDISTSVLSQSSSLLNNIRIVPGLKTEISADNINYLPCEASGIYNRGGRYPDQTVTRGYTAMTGDRRFYSFLVYPFIFLPESNQLEVHQEIVIKINISGTKERFRGEEAGSILDKLDGLVLNNTQSRYWRQAREKDDDNFFRQSEEVNSFRIVINEEGIYEVSYEYIMSELEGEEYVPGFNWDTINPRYLELHDRYGTVPIHFVGEADGSFDPGDYFQFYADINHGDTSWYDDYTSENSLFLSLGSELGARMMIENGGLVEADPDNYNQPQSFEQTLHIEYQNTINHLGAQIDYHDQDYFREDIWWWGEITAPDLKVFDFELQYPHESNIRKASAEVCLFGLTYDGDNINGLNDLNKHRAVVRINSAIVDDIGSGGEWLGQREQIFINSSDDNTSTPILNTDLYHGTNQVSISVPNLINTREQVLFDYLKLTYWREYKTDTDVIKFHKPYKKPIGFPEEFGLYQFDLQGFSTSDVQIYKLGASKIENYSVISLSEEGGAPYMISFQDSVFSNDTEYFALSSNEIKQPKSLEPDLPSNWRSGSNAAEYIIITVKEFAESAVLFEDFWEGYYPDMNVEIVILQDIFDEFNNGIRSAQAIKDFLTYAYNNWSERPKYCLLLGEGLIDERDKSPDRWANKIPTRLAWLVARGATASDNWYGCIVGDDYVSDIGISRLNVTQISEIETVANKTVSFMEEPNYDDLWHGSITLATGGKASEGNIFSKQSERIRNNTIPPEYRINRVYCNVQDMPQQYAGNTTTLINSINDGTLYVQFMGHGASNQWDDYDLFDIYDVANLNNDNYFIASSMSCYGSAFFEGAGVSCIGEALTLDSQGAIAQIGFTGFGFLYIDEPYSKALISAVINPEVNTIGEIVDYTKTLFYASTGNSDEAYSLLQSTGLLGDPRAEIRLPELGTEIALNKFNFSKGDSLILTANVSPEVIEGRFYLYDEDDAPVNAAEFYPFTYQAEDGQIIRSTVIPDSDILPGNTYNRYVKFFGQSAEGEIGGRTNFAIGLPGAFNISWEPLEPEPEDEIDIFSSFFDEEGVDSVACHIKIYSSGMDPFNEAGSYSSHYYQPMVWDEDVGKYHLADPISSLPYNYAVRFEFVITDSTGEQTVSKHLPNENFFRIKGVKFKLTDFSITDWEGEPAVQISISNNGNKESRECSLKLYKGSSLTLLDSIRTGPLGIGNQRWERLSLPVMNANEYFVLRINEEEEFSGTAEYITSSYDITIFEAGFNELEVNSLDGNLLCVLPANLLPEPARFSIIKENGLIPVNQPDLAGITLTSGDVSPAYTLNCYNADLLADSLGTFPLGKRVELIFDISGDQRENGKRDISRYSTYRWEEDYEKWVFMSMEASSIQEIVFYQSSSCGTYSVWENNDQEAPSIDVNVEGQEFTYGGYVSQNGLISFLLSDKNGIDVITKDLEFWINGTAVEESDYSINTAQGRLTSVPVKYQMLQMPEGIHFLQMSCQDFNGNVFSRELSFEVKADFELLNVANYPNPVKSLTIDPLNSGRTRFTYVLTDDADKVTIKVYTVSGRLVKTFGDLPASIGYHEYPLSNTGWDCRDEVGDYLANGVYFYKVIARKGSKKLEKTQKMAILK